MSWFERYRDMLKDLPDREERIRQEEAARRQQDANESRNAEVVRQTVRRNAVEVLRASKAEQLFNNLNQEFLDGKGEVSSAIVYQPYVLHHESGWMEGGARTGRSDTPESLFHTLTLDMDKGFDFEVVLKTGAELAGFTYKEVISCSLNATYYRKRDKRYNHAIPAKKDLREFVATLGSLSIPDVMRVGVLMMRGRDLADRIEEVASMATFEAVRRYRVGV